MRESRGARGAGPSFFRVSVRGAALARVSGASLCPLSFRTPVSRSPPSRPPAPSASASGPPPGRLWSTPSASCSLPSARPRRSERPTRRAEALRGRQTLAVAARSALRAGLRRRAARPPPPGRFGRASPATRSATPPRASRRSARTGYRGRWPGRAQAWYLERTGSLSHCGSSARTGQGARGRGRTGGRRARSRRGESRRCRAPRAPPASAARAPASLERRRSRKRFAAADPTRSRPGSRLEPPTADRAVLPLLPPSSLSLLPLPFLPRTAPRPSRTLGDEVDVLLHGLLLGHALDLGPGVPLGAGLKVDLPRLRARDVSLGGLLEVGIVEQLGLGRGAGLGRTVADQPDGLLELLLELRHGSGRGVETRSGTGSTAASLAPSAARRDA